MGKRFRNDLLDQALLLPPSLHDWLPEGHLARFIADVIEQLDLGAVYQSYAGDGRGLAAYPFAPRGFGLGSGPQCAGLFQPRRGSSRARRKPGGFRRPVRTRCGNRAGPPAFVFWPGRGLQLRRLVLAGKESVCATRFRPWAWAAERTGSGLAFTHSG